MSAQISDRTLPRKCGIVLTCMDNGRKRFRAVPIAVVDEADAAAPATAAPESDVPIFGALRTQPGRRP